MVSVRSLFLFSLLLGHWGDTPSWGVSSKALPSKSQSQHLSKAYVEFGGSYPDNQNGTINSTSYGSVSPLMPAQEFENLSNEKGYTHAKRAGSDSGDEMEVDDEDEIMHDDDDEESFDDDSPYYADAVQKGEINQDMEQENRDLERRPDKDPSIRLDEISFKLNTKAFELFEEVGLKEFWQKIDRIGFITPNSYMAIHGEAPGLQKIFATTMVSIADGHMILTHDRSEFRGSPVYGNLELLAGIWARAQQETEDLYGPTATLEFVSIQKIDHPRTIEQLVIAKKNWFNSGERGRITQGFKVEKSEIPLTNQNSRNVWSALRGIPEVDAIIRMIFTFPHQFRGVLLSSIYVQFDKLDKPTSAKLFLQFEWPVDTTISHNFDWGGAPELGFEEKEDEWGEEPLEDGDTATKEIPPQPKPLAPDQNVLIIESEELSVAKGPVLHPLLPDIDRTTYKASHSPTFKLIESRYMATSDRETNIYMVACSQQEGELVFLGFKNEDYGTPANIAQAGKVLADILYAAWIHETRPDAQINGMAFSSLSPQNEDSLDSAFQENKIESINDIRTVNHFDKKFSKIVRIFLQTDAGKAVKSFVQKYGTGVGNLNLHSIQYGRYAQATGAEGRFFIYITFRSDSSPAAGLESSSASQYKLTKRRLLTGISLYLEILESIQDYASFVDEAIRTRTFQRVVVYTSPNILREKFGFEVVKYVGDTGKKWKIYISPAKDHLKAFLKSSPQIFMRTLWDAKGERVQDVNYSERARLFDGVRYFGVTIGPAGKNNEDNGYKLACYWDHAHLVVLKTPKEEIQKNHPPLEDIMFAAWVSVYGDHKKDGLSQPISTAVPEQTLTVRDGAPIAYISFLEVSQQAEAQMNAIFRWLGEPKSSAICLRNTLWEAVNGHRRQRPGSQLNGLRALASVHHIRLYWLLMLTTPEVKAVARMFEKYKRQTTRGSSIDGICLRWRGAVGDESPEILVTSTPFARTKQPYVLDYIRSLQSPARDTRTRGLRSLIFQLVVPYIGPSSDNEPQIPATEYSFESGTSTPQIIEGANLACRTIEEFKVEFPEGFAYDLKGPHLTPYLPVTATSQTERVTYNFIVSSKDRYVIIPETVPGAGLDITTFIERLGRILARVWMLSRDPDVDISLEAKRRLRPDTIRQRKSLLAVRFVSFLKISHESEQEFSKILRDFSVIWSGRIQVLFASHLTQIRHDDGNMGPLVSVNNVLGFVAFVQILGLKEISAVSIMMQDYPSVVYAERIMAVGISGTRGNLQLSLHLKRKLITKSISKPKGRNENGGEAGGVADETGGSDGE
ncbi:hypothetical protein TWF506_004696 [Arthrobotrys conoides]|uniref:Uncharacterized protein n=1 Tax=Arthrobotrys conoides TaxID=74498 RepID=A0AAN8P3H2_9PEZI